MGFFDSLFGKKKEEKKPEEKRICPVCGNSFTGRGMDVHDLYCSHQSCRTCQKG